MTWDYSKLSAAAQANVDNLLAVTATRDFNKEALTIAMSKRHTKVDKLFRIFRLTDEINKVATPHSACRNGCNHCCNMAVSVTVLEAREIAKRTGLEYVQEKTPLSIPETQEKYMGTPCPFLGQGKCSIYAVRPISCRVYFNMSDTPEICDVVTYPKQDVPCLNMQGVQLAQSVALGVDFQDIRDWFPTKKG